MDREKFKNRLKQYKQAREENPGLKYWEWKNIPKYGNGTNSVQTDYEIPWWQRIINSGEKVQPISQQDVTNYQEQQLQQRHQISKNIMREVESIGVYGEPYLFEDRQSFDPQTVFLLNEKDQQTIMERNGYKKVDISTEKDPYGLVRSAANFHNKTKNVPVYEYTIGSDSTVTRDQLSHLFSYNARDVYNARLLPHVGNVPIAVYINPETGKVYKREYDLNDYGPVDGNATGFIGNVSSVKQFGGRMLDVLGTPFVQRTGFYEVLQPRDLMNEPGVSEQQKRTLINGLTNYYNINNKDLPNWLFNVQNFAEGGEVNDPRQNVLKRANRVSTNYGDAVDFTLDPFNYAVRKIAKTLTGRGGISNCTLSATGWIDPNNQYMSAKNIFDNPGSGYTEIDKAYALPGDLLIAKNPKEGSYHTMLIESFNGDDPVLRYSRGGHNTEKNLVTGRSLEEYHRLDNEQGGNHTEDHYFRYNFPNEYWLPEIIVTPKR